jgi:hypothetical protein
VDDTAPAHSSSPTGLKVKNEDAPRSIFPDGIRTSGQHPPLYDVLRPYSDFPKEIVGPTVWHREQFIESSEGWTHPFSDDEINELGRAADNFIASGTALTGISKVRLFYPVTASQAIDSEPLLV